MSADLSFDLLFGGHHPFPWLGSPFTTMSSLNSPLTCFQNPGRVDLFLFYWGSPGSYLLFPSWPRLELLPLVSSGLCFLESWIAFPFHRDFDAVPLSWAAGIFQGICLTVSGQFVGLRELVLLPPLWDSVISEFSLRTPPPTCGGWRDHSFILCRGVCCGDLTMFPQTCIPRRITGYFVSDRETPNWGKKILQRRKSINKRLERIIDTIHK